ncbi:thiamine pyrophosphate-binding protein [Actinokineospora enzanensis]|uniref:thiamine pyrophosphate-binding protein n=1 Tax=Actinokineospora enzanensis TaxID=155975 RepID=UPI00037B10F5|nr:thiamine pyrophosphate-binding protein [Actinokineospora enzanensis]
MGNGADLLVESLTRRGVDTVFGFPGDTSIALYDVLRRRADEIRHVLARDERHAGFMADAFSRATGRLGVCEAPSGAGAVYLASGLAEALTSSIPLVALATDNNTRSAGTAPISEMDQDALFAACTKWRRTVTDPRDIPAAVEAAIRAATTGRPGPVALIFPEDVLEAELDDAPPQGTLTRAEVATDRPAGRLDAVRIAAHMLADAAHPVIVAGGGAHLSGAWPELRALAERGAVPVATTIHGKGALDEAHPLALGVIGANGARDYANARLAEADAVLFVGTRANATDTLGFTAPPRDGSVKVAHIEADEGRAGHNYPRGVAMVGDAKAVLAQVVAAIPAAAEEVRAARSAEIAAARAVWASHVDADTPVLDEGVVHPREVVRALGEAFGRDTWIAADAGTPTPYLSSFWECPGDGWRVVIPRGHGPMGFAIPASIALAVGHPGSRVLCLTTENSVAMAVGEWETAARLRLPVTYVVLDNTSMGWIKMIQHLYAGGRYFAVDPGPLDPVLLAAGMGVTGARAHTAAEFAVLAKQAATAEGPSVIHVAVPSHIEVPPPVASWQAALSGAQRTRPIH